MPIITDPLPRLRLEIGDTDVANPLFVDDELNTLLAEQSNDILLAAAVACDILATRFATDFDFEWQGSENARGKFSRSQMSKMFADRAKVLRERAAQVAAGLPLSSFPAPWCLDF